MNTSKPRSFWTGVPKGENTYQPGPEEGTSILTLKEPFQVPRGTNAALSYNSNFVNAPGDKGRVQVAIDTGAREQLEWITVDSFASGAGDADTLTIFEEQQNDDSGVELGFTRRFADLTKFAGRRLKMRFIYDLGPHDPTFPFARPGWYIDDVKVVAGSYREIGQTTAKRFTVAERRKGTYAYRVKAVFEDNVKSSASNSEAVTVTRGDPDGPGGRSAGDSACGVAAAFNRLRVRPLRRDLRIDVAPAVGPAAVELIRVGSSRRALKPRRIARLRSVSRSTTLKRRRIPSGWYIVRVSGRTPQGARDVRQFAMRRVRGRFRTGKAFTRLSSCGLLSAYSLSSPVFSGRRPLTARVAATQPARLVLSVYRGKSKRPAARFVRNLKAGRAARIKVRGRRIRRGGEYRVIATVTRPGERARATLRSRRLR